MYQKVDYPERECAYCGESFKPKTKSTRFCSRVCSHKAWVVNSPDAAAESKRKSRIRAKANKYYRHKARGPFTCKNCGAKYYTNRPAGEGEKYCSRECSFEHKRVAPFSKVRFKMCLICGEWFRAKNRERICSDQCRRRHAAEKSREYSESKHRPKDRACKECGKTFAPEYGSKRRVFCSSECARKNANRLSSSDNRDRAKKHGVKYEYINPMKVFKRDGWTCQICGKKTPRRLRGTCKPNAPELDHRIPISTGGNHTWDNVQCACRQCNADKSNTKPLGQMSLFNKVA